MPKCHIGVISVFLIALLHDGVFSCDLCYNSPQHFRFAVRIRPITNTSSLQDCSGYIQDSTTIITSASCASQQSVTKMTLIVQPKGKESIKYNVTKWTVHPKYHEHHTGYNLMVLKLDNPLPYDGNTEFAVTGDSDNFKEIRYFAGSNKEIYRGRSLTTKDYDTLPYGSYSARFQKGSTFIGGSEGDLILDEKNRILGIYDKIFSTGPFNLFVRQKKITWTAVDKFIDWIGKVELKINSVSQTPTEVVTPSNEETTDQSTL